MSRPFCLIGSALQAEKWVDSNIIFKKKIVLKSDVLMDDIKFFRKLLIEPSLDIKVGIIYYFNNLSDAKQSVFLKIFEEVPDNCQIVIHSSGFVNFTIHTRCNLFYLNNSSVSSEDLKWVLEFFKKSLKNRCLNKEIINGIKIYLETLDLFENGFLTEHEKNNILDDLK